MKVDPVIARNINGATIVQSCMKDRDRIVLCHIDLIQNTEATILGTLIDAALSEADFIVYKGIRSDQVSAVCIDMERYIINRAAKSICQIFCQDIFPVAFGPARRRFSPSRSPAMAISRISFPVERYGRSGNSGCSPLINVIIFFETPRYRGSGFRKRSVLLKILILSYILTPESD